MLMILQFEKEVVIMFSKELYTNANVTFSLVAANSTFVSKTLYDSPTLMEIIFS